MGCRRFTRGALAKLRGELTSCARPSNLRRRVLAGGGITPWERVSVVPSVGRLSGVKDRVAGGENPARNAGEARTKKDLGAGRGGPAPGAPQREGGRYPSTKAPLGEQPGSLAVGSGAVGTLVFIEGATLKSNMSSSVDAFRSRAVRCGRLGRLLSRLMNRFSMSASNDV